MEQWFAFKAYNSQTLYGFGTAAEADRYADAINATREINVYGAYPVAEPEAVELKLNDNSEAFNLDDELRAREEDA